jgi:hypothetical protein
MMRCGSATFNYASNNSCLITTTMNNVSSSATALQFAGGVPGCYGYFTNETTIWPSAYTTSQYGLISSVLKPLGGYPAAGDKLFIRANKTINFSGPVNLNATWQNGGTVTSPTIWEIDDGTEWPADGVDPRFIFQINCGSNNQYLLSGSGFMIVRGKKYTSGLNNFVFALVGSNALFNTFALPICTPVTLWYNVDFDACTYNTSGSGGILIGSSGNAQLQANATSAFTGCRFLHKGSGNFVAAGTTNTYNVTFKDCTFSNVGALVKNNGIFSISGITGVIVLDNCKFEDFIVGSALTAGGMGTAISSTVAAQFILINQRWNNVTARGPFALTFNSLGYTTNVHSIYGASSIDTQDLLLDTKQGFCEWNATRGQPTLNARLLDGITPMSYRFISSTLASNLSYFVPFELPKISKYNTLPTGQRTFTVEFCLEQNLVWTKGDVWPVFEYVTTGGKTVTLDGFDENRGALTVSTSTWSQESAGKPTFVDGGSLSHNKYKFVLTTAVGRDVLTETEIVMTFRIAGVAGNVTQGGFLCPEFLVT